MLFWIMLLLFVFFSWLYVEYTEKDYKFVSISVLVMLCIISGLRDHLGNDYDTYVMDYYLYANFNLDSLFAYVRREPTETVIVYILNELNFDYQMLFVVYSIVTYLFVWIILKDVLKKYQLIMLAIVVFVIDYNMMWYSYSIIRQFVAALVCLYSMKYIESNNLFKFVLVVFFAFLWHYSSIVFLLAYFVPRTPINMKTYFAMIIMGMIVFYTNASRRIIESLIEYIPFLSDYSYYLIDWVEEEAISLSMLFFYNVFLGILFLYFLKDEKTIYVNVFCIYNILYLLCRFCTPLLRMTIYFGMSILILLPLLYTRLGHYKKYIIIFMMIIPMSVSFLKAIAAEEERIGDYLSVGNIEYNTNFEHIFKD